MPRWRPVDVKAIVVVGSAQGGVGKTAICANVAAAIAIAGRKVAIVDADLNSPGIFGMLGVKSMRRFLPGEEIEPVSGPLGIRVVSSALIADGEPAAFSFVDSEEPPAAVLSNNGARPLEIDWRATMRRLLGARFGPLDLMLVDLASGIAQLHHLAGMLDLAGVVVVTRPSEAAARATHAALEAIAHAHAPVLALVENMLGFNCDSCHTTRPLFPQGAVPELAQSAQALALQRLPFDPRLADSCERGIIFVREYPDTPLAKLFSAIAQGVDRGISAYVEQHSPVVSPA
jgi:ATP-binding protein involved in chromosome partitioning